MKVFVLSTIIFVHNKHATGRGCPDDATDGGLDSNGDLNSDGGPNNRRGS